MSIEVIWDVCYVHIKKFRFEVLKLQRLPRVLLRTCLVPRGGKIFCCILGSSFTSDLVTIRVSGLCLFSTSSYLGDAFVLGLKGIICSLVLTWSFLREDGNLHI